ncbi:alpha-glucuronidase [Marinihelvus fidelis]|uniref:Xylan alpha-1,2-glucuronidase n=1 Tax=Marinihelvus fidelis TaxID=2613842 RepID=A0A5N0TD69_9GAMM|nr:alpha-glucuronidase family glycosyl hydrolase [Marinihelvus fidelis]KAA9132628.1 alpha-glucuronidase [Marinihelvus fidelis]
MALMYTNTAMGAEDGYRLWLRYESLATTQAESLRSQARRVVIASPRTATLEAAAGELRRGIEGLSAGAPIDVIDMPAEGPGEGDVVIGTTGGDWRGAPEQTEKAIGPGGYRVSSQAVHGGTYTAVEGQDQSGVLYGVFALLRALQSGNSIDSIELADHPRVGLRLLNHWDNLDRYVERGYAGQSLWDWWRLPDLVDPRYTDYARANASIGINGTVLNNVNAAAEVLTPRYIAKAAKLADVFRPWGIRVYLSARWSAPRDIGGLDTADPLDPAVRAWWAAKADEIYAAIPDFGGFLVKANSEGQPGPREYGRSHADGANMLAAALAPHGGVVMWRAFVYSETDPEDRVRQAYTEFKPLDGTFADNVLVQVKNGPLDFQPREPFHPMFGGMPGTPLMMEFQLTKEYLGFSTHLVYLGALWEEVLQTDTFAQGGGSTVAKVVDGRLDGHELTGIAGVANIGRDRDWSGSDFDQANWYAFGRLAWNPDGDAHVIAREWLQQTFSTDPAFVEPAAELMMRSREAVVNYMTPLGLTHIMGTGHHYGPAPWVDDLGRPEWNPFYYHRADADGIGFDRTASGSNAVEQYHAPVGEQFGSLESVPDEYLLWFHRVPWDYRLRDGTTLWQALARQYDQGVGQAEAMRAEWETLGQHVDPVRRARVADYLDIQVREAKWWRDACLAYFQARSGLDWPDGVTPPPLTLDDYRAMQFPYAPGN